MIKIFQCNSLLTRGLFFCSLFFVCSSIPLFGGSKINDISVSFFILGDQALMEQSIKKECRRLQGIDKQVTCITVFENVASTAALLYGAYQFYKYYSGPDVSEQADYTDFLQQLYKSRGGEFTWQDRPTFLKRIFRYAAVQGCASIIATLGSYALHKHQEWHMGKKQYAVQYISMAKMVIEDQGQYICQSLVTGNMASITAHNELFAQGIINMCAYLMYKEQKRTSRTGMDNFSSMYTIMRKTLQKQASEYVSLVSAVQSDVDEVTKQKNSATIEAVIQSILTLCEHVWKYEQNAINDTVRGNQEAIL